jgi:thiol:disulfide interchange protein DsbA
MKTLAALLLMLLLPIVALAANDAPVEGVDYAVIDGGTPFARAPGVEIAEVFAYSCPHCWELQPALEAWKGSLPRGVRLTYVPAVFSEGDAFARAYFAASDIGAAARLHEALYRAVHVDGTLARNPTVDELAAWFGGHGLDPAKMRAAMLSPAVDRHMRAAHDFALRSQLEGTPTLVVGGRYRVTARTRDDTLRIARQLAERLRAR